MPGQGRGGGLSGRTRLVLSLLLSLHLAAVFLGAWNGAPPFSLLGEALVAPLRPYINAADLNHGYRFFAPNPGPSHLLDYQLTTADGRTVSGRLPDLRKHQPRLLYHRFFMLTEHVVPLLLPPDVPADKRAADDKRFQSIMNSVAQELLEREGGQKVELKLIRHQIPSPGQVRDGTPLHDPKLYETLWTGQFESQP